MERALYSFDRHRPSAELCEVFPEILLRDRSVDLFGGSLVEDVLVVTDDRAVRSVFPVFNFGHLRKLPMVLVLYRTVIRRLILKILNIIL